MVYDGGITDDDGHGYYCTATHRSKVSVIESENPEDHPIEFTHVLWFNK